MTEKRPAQPDRCVIQPGSRSGSVLMPSSKSQLHRLLIGTALGDSSAQIACRGIPEDIRATMRCLNALGAAIEVLPDGPDTSRGGQILRIEPLDRSNFRDGAVLDCGESASTLRFLLPAAGMLGVSCTFVRRGRLPLRPLAPFDEQLRAHGMTLIEDGPFLSVSGRLRGGEYVLPGNISSQYVSGLLMAISGLQGHSRLRVEGTLESSKYISMTEAVLRRCGIRFSKEIAGGQTVWTVDGGQQAALPERIEAEGDWSAASAFLCMGALSKEGILVKGLDPDSAQPDRAVLDVLRQAGAFVALCEEGVFVRRNELKAFELDASQTPDAVPALAALASLCEGTTSLFHAERLRYKESDRLWSTVRMLRALGADAAETQGGITINGRPSLSGGPVHSSDDHRIAMAAAVAACGCREPVQIVHPGCVAKSYPDFWQDLNRLRIES